MRLVRWASIIVFLFRVESNRSSSAFELFIQMSGVIVVSSSKDFRYFLIFVDDFSRMTWLYLLKERSDVFGVIKLFHNEIKTHFSTFIRVLRTDNALEYMKNVVSFFVLRMKLFIKPPALIHPKRMVLRNANTDTS